MKGWIIRGLLLAALGAIGFWLWTVMFPSPQKIIRQRLAEVAQLASFSQNEGPLAKLANSQKLAGYLAPNVEIRLDMPGRSERRFTSRDEIMQAAIAARGMLTGLTVTFPDIAVTVAPDKQSAVVGVTLRADVHGDGEKIIQEMRVVFQKLNGDWLITRVETVKTLTGIRPRSATNHRL